MSILHWGASKVIMHTDTVLNPGGTICWEWCASQYLRRVRRPPLARRRGDRIRRGARWSHSNRFLQALGRHAGVQVRLPLPRIPENTRGRIIIEGFVKNVSNSKLPCRLTLQHHTSRSSSYSAASRSSSSSSEVLNPPRKEWLTILLMPPAE